MALSSALVSLGILIGIYALLSIGLNIKFGYGGLLDIGHVMFYLVGAYGVALLVASPAEGGISQTYILGLELPWVIAGAIAIAAAAVLGMIVALPAIRLREDYLAITVLGFSEIARRIIQNEGWLANGPRSLRGYSTPLADYFPLPQAGTEEILLFTGIGKLIPIQFTLRGPLSEILLGVLVVILWAVGAYIITMVLENRRPSGLRGWVTHVTLAILSVGIGYLAAIRSLREGDRPKLQPMILGGVLMGALVTIGSIAVSGALTLLVVLGLYSVLTWVLAVLAVIRRYEGIDRRDGLYGFGLALAFIATLLPLVALGAGGDDLLSSAGLVLTLGALSAFIYGIYYIGGRWDQYGSGAPFLRVLGIAALWLFAIRYFVLDSLSAFTGGSAIEAVDNFLQNLLWLVRFSPSGAELGYNRFLFILTLGLVAGIYLLAETTVTSPFGRVLKAIREDEDVATALGKNTFVSKTQAMMLGSAVAGLAGVMLAMHRGSLTHLMFRPLITFQVFLMVIIGGVANNRGVILGAVIFWAFRQVTVDLRGFFPSDASARLAALRIAFIGALLILILYYRPEGIWGEEQMAVGEVEE